MSKRKRRPPQSVVKIQDAKAKDSYSNPIARLGLDQPNTSEGAIYTITRLTQNYNLMNALYRNNWICRRLIDVVPEDMMKNGYKITSQLKPEAITKIEKLERKTQLRKRILSGLKWGRLYGGAVGVIIIDGQDDMLSEPLDYDTIVPGAFKGIIILDRWSGISAGADIVKNISDPDYGLPEYYNTYGGTIESVRVHHSRVVRFTGRDLPFIEEQMETHWGASELEHVFDEIKKRDNTSWNIAQLVFMANLRVLKMEGMEGITATMNTSARESLYNTMSAQNTMMNNSSMQIIGSNDDFQTHQYTFSGLSDVYESFMMDVAGAAEMPVTKLFGRSPAGMDATGESDMQNYYDSIEEKQEASLRPIYDRLLPIMCMSEFGAIPDDLDYEFKPIRRLSDQERVELASKHTQSIIDAYNAGLISQRIALKEMQQMRELTGTWSNITDEDIAKADDSFDMAVEMPGIGGMLPDFKQPSTAMALDGEFKEEDHPRAENGQFGSGGSGGESSKPDEKEDSKPDDKNDKGKKKANKSRSQPVNLENFLQAYEEKNGPLEIEENENQEQEKIVKCLLDAEGQRMYNKAIIGLTASNGVEVKEFSPHSFNRIVEKNVSVEAVRGALIDTTLAYPVRLEDWGGYVQRLRGENAAVAIEIYTGIIVSVWDKDWEG